MPENMPESEARTAVLERIRATIGTRDRAAAVAAWADLPRNYRVASEASPEDVLHRLIDRLQDYDAVVHRTTPGNVTEALTRALAQSNAVRLVVAPGFPQAVLPPGLPHRLDDGFSAKELDSFDTVLTTATLAIAETGTLVLQNAPGQGRRAVSLVPDTHICLLRAADVVATVPEAMRRLQATATLPTTFVSGPSATADIEMTRIKGVHGPRFLHVVLVES